MAHFQLDMQLAPVVSMEDGRNGVGTSICFYSSQNHARISDPDKRHENAWLILDFESAKHLANWWAVNGEMIQIVTDRLLLARKI